MENEALSKLIPISVLLFLGIIEALGGLYFNDKRSRNDFSIELLSLITLPTLIQPGIFLFVLWFMGVSFPGSRRLLSHLFTLVARCCLSYTR